MLCKIEDAAKMIEEGRSLMISGNAETIGELPRGNWIGGTTPYLMTENGGIESGGTLLVKEMPTLARLVSIQRYGVGGLHYLPHDTPANGFTIVIIPSSSLVHQTYAKAIPTYNEIGDKAIAGWVSGSLTDNFSGRPKVFYGPVVHAIEDEIVAMHMSLPDSAHASIDVINLYEPDEGDEIKFITEGFTVTHAMVNGRLVLFAEYLKKNWKDTSIPLVGDFKCARLNVNINKYDIESGCVVLYAPVFKNVVYRFAKPVKDFQARLSNAIVTDNSRSIFECICIKNYEKLSMGKQSLGHFEGPVSYGEIAHYLTNQSVVRVLLEDRG